MASSWWPFWPFSNGSSSSPANFLHLSRSNIERMCKLTAHEEPLNPHQCRRMSSTLERAMQSIERLVDSVDNINLVYGSAALENFYRVSEKAKQLVENCCREDWCQECAFQIQNEEAFKGILLETSLCYNTICKVVEDINCNREFLYEDLCESSIFDPPSAYEVFQDRVALQDRLKGLVKDANISDSHIRSQHLGKYLLERVDYALQHSSDEDFDIKSFNLWVDGKGPDEEWSEKSDFLGGNVCKTAWLGVPCAKKFFQDEMQEDEWLAEAKILASLNHPNIVKFLCCNKYKTKHTRGHFIAMEQMDTSLGSFIKSLKEDGAKLSLFLALDIILQIAYGMCYLHENGIAHRDLKTSNVVVRKLTSPQLQYYLQVKIADFGISKTKLQDKSNTITRPKIGTTLYMAPEAFSNGRANWFKVDVYSFSVMCSVILSGGEPFQNIKRNDICGAICSGKRPTFPEDTPKELASVIREGWATDRNSRPNFFEIYTRLEKLRHQLLRDHTLGSRAKREEYDYWYIEEMLRRRFEHASRHARLQTLIQSTEEEEWFDGDEVAHHPLAQQAQQASTQQQQVSSAQQIENQSLSIGSSSEPRGFLPPPQQLASLNPTRHPLDKLNEQQRGYYSWTPFDFQLQMQRPPLPASNQALVSARVQYSGTNSSIISNDGSDRLSLSLGRGTPSLSLPLRRGTPSRSPEIQIGDTRTATGMIAPTQILGAKDDQSVRHTLVEGDGGLDAQEQWRNMGMNPALEPGNLLGEMNLLDLLDSSTMPSMSAFHSLDERIPPSSRSAFKRWKRLVVLPRSNSNQALPRRCIEMLRQIPNM